MAGSKICILKIYQDHFTWPLPDHYISGELRLTLYRPQCNNRPSAKVNGDILKKIQIFIYRFSQFKKCTCHIYEFRIQTKHTDIVFQLFPKNKTVTNGALSSTNGYNVHSIKMQNQSQLHFHKNVIPFIRSDYKFSEHFRKL